ncbi:MAG TPA: GNAT family N-acetyltransferase [Lachnospiraceae bacterium]|nr:GNAT family N-acetyltransferase [Lachnospiraceae bacterium]
MKIQDNVLRHYLKNCYFITGTAYAGKSTMCKMLAEKFHMIHCEENYNMDAILSVVSEEQQPNFNYFNTKIDWQQYVNRTPEEFEAWYHGTAREVADFEVAQLIRISANQKVIVDTNIPVDLLKRITDETHVAIMLSPQSMSVEKFFERGDEEKQFLLSVIKECPNPEKTLQNFKDCIANINSKENYDVFRNSGFFTIVRENTEKDTREETLHILARHFGLEGDMEVIKVEKDNPKWNELITFSQNCSWIAGKHLAGMLERNAFEDWEGVFAAVKGTQIVGYCTFLKTDYYPENRYSPWISSIFVDENHRGTRISEKMINKVIEYAKKQGFSKVYIPSDMLDFYEKYGFTRIDELQNYGGDMDHIFMKEI